MAIKASFTMTDDALVTFGKPVPGGIAFQDKGFMPVASATLNGYAIPLPKGEALFMSYNATGVQHFSPAGVPTTADYTSLHYDLYAGQGKGTFTHAANGTPTYSGLQNLARLAEGDLIKGQLTFTPTGGVAGTIATTANVGGRHVGKLSISVQHAASDLGHTAMGGITLTGGSLHATFV